MLHSPPPKVPDGPKRDASQRLYSWSLRSARRDDDRLPVWMRGIEILHVADGYAVVVPVAYDLVLDLLPAVQALLDQHLARPEEKSRRSAASNSAGVSTMPLPGRRARIPRAA